MEALPLSHTAAEALDALFQHLNVDVWHSPQHSFPLDFETDALFLRDAAELYDGPNSDEASMALLVDLCDRTTTVLQQADEAKTLARFAGVCRHARAIADQQVPPGARVVRFAKGEAVSWLLPFWGAKQFQRFAARSEYYDSEYYDSEYHDYASDLEAEEGGDPEHAERAVSVLAEFRIGEQLPSDNPPLALTLALEQVEDAGNVVAGPLEPSPLVQTLRRRIDTAYQNYAADFFEL